VLELIDTPCRHAIHLRRGMVQAVESELAGTRLGDVTAQLHQVERPLIERARMAAHAKGTRIGQAMVSLRVLSPLQLDESLRAQRHVRLEHLYALRDAEVRFRIARPLPAGSSEQQPLAPRDVFHGRPRKSPRASQGFASARRSQPAPAPVTVETPVDARRAARLAALGLGPNASDVEARAAYKRLVLALHPDRLGPDASEALRAERGRGLISVVRAYRELAP